MDDQEWIGGKHSLLEAMRAGRTINKIWVAEGAQKHLTQPIIAEAKQHGIIVQFVDKRKLDQMAPGLQHQGLSHRLPLMPMWKWKIFCRGRSSAESLLFC